MSYGDNSSSGNTQTFIRSSNKSLFDLLFLKSYRKYD